MTIGDFTSENGRGSVAVGGSLDLTCDKAAPDAVVHALESDATLPDKPPPPKAATEVRNPFA